VVDCSTLLDRNDLIFQSRPSYTVVKVRWAFARLAGVRRTLKMIQRH